MGGNPLIHKQWSHLQTEAPIEMTWHVDNINPLELGEPVMLHARQGPCRQSSEEEDVEVPKPLVQPWLAEVPSQSSKDLHGLTLEQSRVCECTLEHSLESFLEQFWWCGFYQTHIPFDCNQRSCKLGGHWGLQSEKWTLIVIGLLHEMPRWWWESLGHEEFCRELPGYHSATTYMSSKWLLQGWRCCKLAVDAAALCILSDPSHFCINSLLTFDSCCKSMSLL